MGRRAELKISGGTELERVLVRDYIFSHFGRRTNALRVNCDWVVYCHIDDEEDEDEFYDMNQYLNDMATTCRSTLKVEEVRL